MLKLNTIPMSVGAAFYALLFSGAAIGLLDTDNKNSCGGVNRWRVGIASDDAASRINTKIENGSIKAFSKLVTDSYEIKRKTARQDIEKQVYLLKNCSIVNASLEEDGDLRMVIKDDSGHSMVAEIPEYRCPNVKESEFYEDIKAVRQLFENSQTDYKKYKWNITGVLFMDKEHFNEVEGKLDNNIEIHPVIGLQKGAQIKK